MFEEELYPLDISVQNTPGCGEKLNKLILRSPFILKHNTILFSDPLDGISDIICSFRDFLAIASIPKQFHHLSQFLFSTSQRN